MLTWLKQEAALLWWSAALLLISAICIVINTTTTHYHGTEYNLQSTLLYLPWAIGMFFISAYLRKMSERFSLLFDTIGKIYWIFLMFSIGVYAIQFTSFPLIDLSLLRFDAALDFSTKAVYQFTQHHHLLFVIAQFIYKSLSLQILVIPLILSFLLEKKSLHVFFLSNLISAVVVFSIYYFFPTTVPAHVVPMVNFTVEQYGVIAQWYEIHYHLANYIHVGDLIGFPSYHVIWALFLIYAVKNRAWFFYPLLVWNSVLMVSTMLLGWHFLVDVLAGLVVGMASLYIAEGRLRPLWRAMR